MGSPYVYGILAIILTLILVVGVHEAGHALAARLFLVRIKKISIGFGKPIIQWRNKGGCDWVWAIWPLGGYVQLLNSRNGPVEPSQESFCFDRKSIGVRCIILLAGAFANLLTAWLVFVLVFYLGISYRLPEIKSVQLNSVAAKAGIVPGDQLITIEEKSTASWNEVGMQLLIFWGEKAVKVTLKNVNSQKLKEVTLDLSQIKFTQKERSLLASVGINPNLAAPSILVRASSFWAALGQATAAITHLIYFFLVTLERLITHVIPFSVLLGPIGIFAASIASLIQGFVVFCYFIASLSLAVAVVNLFPIPGLDGGSILYLFIEKLRGKPLSVAMEVLLHRLMFIVFSLVLVQLILNDLLRFF